MLYHSLKEDFGVPQVAARLWGKVPGAVVPARARGDVRPRSATTPTSSAQPYCGPVARVRVARLVRGRRHACTSFAFLPLRTAQTFGLLALGESGSASASIPGMGTVYLTRLAELASVATARFLPRS